MSGQGNIIFSSNPKSSSPAGSGNFKVLDFVTDIVATNGTPFDELVVKDNVRGGSFLKYTGAQVDDQGIIFTDSAGNRWKRVIESDYVNIQWYGAIGVTVQQFDSYSAFFKAFQASKNLENVQFPNVYIPGLDNAGLSYFMSSQITLDVVCTIFGDGQLSQIAMNTNLNGILIGASIDGTTLKDFNLNPFLDRTALPAFAGIKSFSRCVLNNVIAQHFNGNGFEFVAGVPSSNVNNSQIINCSASQNSIHGFYLQGSDANHCNFVGNSSTSNGGCGLVDASFLGNSHESWHFATNGSVDIAWQRGLVTDGVNVYQALQDNFSGQPLSNTAYWYNIGNAWVAFAPAFNIATIYYRAGSFFTTGLNQSSVLVNCYGESDQAPGHLSERTFTLSGLHANGVIGADLQADGSQLFLNNSSFNVQDTTLNVLTKIAAGQTAWGVPSSPQVLFKWIAAILGIDIGNGATFIFSTSATAANENRTNNAIPGVLSFYNGFLMANQTNAFKSYWITAQQDKPAPGGDIGDLSLAITNGSVFTSDKPEVVLYKNLDGTQMVRILGYCEYQFQTTDATPFVICIDELFDHIIYNSKYDIDILAVNPANGDVYSERRLDVVSFMSGTPPPPILAHVKNSVVIEPVFQEASLVGASVEFNLTVYKFQLEAHGLAATTINWKVQVKRTRL